ncbi:MAG: TolC family protein, partial [Muribaculaceae bacterium]|nr:TolC family protein [Muribaculaceae bacterium]
MKNNRYYLILFLPLLLCGCGLYGKFDGAQVEYDAGALCVTDTVNAPLSALSWRELFSDGYLEAWIDSALKSNTDLRMAQIRT